MQRADRVMIGAEASLFVASFYGARTGVTDGSNCREPHAARAAAHVARAHCPSRVRGGRRTLPSLGEPQPVLAPDLPDLADQLVLAPGRAASAGRETTPRRRSASGCARRL